MLNLKPFLIGLALLLGPSMHAQEKPAQKKLLVAVLDTTGNRGVTEISKRSARGVLEEYVTKSQKYQLVDRARTNQILQEQSFQREGMVDSATAKKVAMLLGADFVFASELFKEEGYVNANISLINAETGEAAAVSEMIDKDTPMEIRKLIEALAARLLGAADKK
jgi:TolB-like protein